MGAVPSLSNELLSDELLSDALLSDELLSDELLSPKALRIEQRLGFFAVACSLVSRSACL